MPKTSKSRRKRQSRRTQAVIASTPRVVGAFSTGTGAAQQLFKPLRVALAFYHSVDIDTPYEDIRFSMNSLYDPLYDTGGGACSYFTSFAQIYPRYYVRSARIEVSAKTTGVDTVIAIVPSNSAHPNVILTLDHAWSCLVHSGPGVLIMVILRLCLLITQSIKLKDMTPVMTAGFMLAPAVVPRPDNLLCMFWLDPRTPA